jgi:hypothetical protein
MRALKTLAVIAAAMVCVAASARAQSADSLAPGSRVRVGLNGQLRDVGTLVRSSSNSIDYVPEGEKAVVALKSDEIGSLEVSRGKHGHAGMGALIGAGAGLALGVAFVAAIESDPWFDLEAGEAAGAIIVTTMGGTLLGTAIGAAIRTESWDEVGLSERRAGMRVDLAVTVPIGR